LLVLKDEYGIKHRDLKPQNILIKDDFIYLLADYTTCKYSDGESSVLVDKNSMIDERTT
jgi:serine/threonine protein kinase